MIDRLEIPAHRSRVGLGETLPTVLHGSDTPLTDWISLSGGLEVAFHDSLVVLAVHVIISKCDLSVNITLTDNKFCWKGDVGESRGHIGNRKNLLA